METVILFTARFPLSREQRAVTDAVEPINRFRVNAVFHGHAHNGILDVKLRPAFPFTTPLGRRFAKPASLTVSSNCRASMSGANRSERFLSHHAPCFYIGAALCG
jgi:hypothetical protein